MKLTKSIWALIVFNALYIIGFALYYMSIGNYEFLIYIGVLICIALLILFTLHRTRLDGLALWGLSIWGLVHMIGGGVRVNGVKVYGLHLIELVNRGGDFYILKMDQVIHFYGFAVSAIVIFQLCWPYFQQYRLRTFSLFIAWIGSMGLGAINEVVEFFAFVVVANTGVGDSYNTGLDLVFNLFGALVGALIAYTIYKNKKYAARQRT